MRFIIENPSSPGASLTSNTEQTILACADFIEKNQNLQLNFIDFRRRLEHEYGINDNNARNIYPLLKYLGFVNYEPGMNLSVNEFFSPQGKAYVKSIQSIHAIEDSPELDTETKKNVVKQFKELKENITLNGLRNILNVSHPSYAPECLSYLFFLDRYRSIDKKEAALLVYERKNNPQESLGTVIQNLSNHIERYRAGQEDFEVQINVRNDDATGDGSGSERRLEAISYFTSFSYIAKLLLDAGLIEKQRGGKFSIKNNKAQTIHELIEEAI